MKAEVARLRADSIASKPNTKKVDTVCLNDHICLLARVLSWSDAVDPHKAAGISEATRQCCKSTPKRRRHTCSRQGRAGASI